MRDLLELLAEMLEKAFWFSAGGNGLHGASHETKAR